MSKPYWSGQGGRTGSSYVDDDSPTHRTRGYDSSVPSSGFYSSGGYRTTDEYRDADYSSHTGYDADFPDDFPHDEDAYEYYSDTRWRWIAGLAVAVLLAAVLAITMVMRSDSTTPTAQTAPPATSTAPRTVIATVPPSTAPPSQAQLAPETVVTITTTPSAVVPPPVAAPPPEAAPPAPATPDPRTVTYNVTGTRQLIDLVSIIYTDEQGLPRTEVNVTLPWTKTLVLNPGVDFESVTATSVTGQLNCAITDATGATLVAQNNNSMIATCTG
jgi:hypothetical protein